MRKRTNKIITRNNGFTLVELIVVIAIIALLTVALSPLYLDYVEKTRKGTDENAVWEVVHAAEVVFVDIDKDEEQSTMEIRIEPDGTAGYSPMVSELVQGVNEVISQESYKYKSEFYKGKTVAITMNSLTGKAEVIVDGNFNLSEEIGLRDFANQVLPSLGIDPDRIDWDKFDKEVDKLLNEGEQFSKLDPDRQTEIVVEALWNSIMPDDTCVAAGSEITLADGSRKKVEDLVTTDKLLAFNHENGEYVAADILAVVFHGNGFYHVMNLGFTNGETVKLIGHHALFDTTLNQYVFLTNDNFMDYVGHEFAMQSEEGYETSTLEYAFLSYEYTGSYAVLTDYHMNCFTDGFFSNIYAAKVVANAFEYDSDLKYDAEKMQEDIKTYGLYTYEDFAPYVSKEAYDLLPFPYIKVCEGKGIISQEEVLSILGEYSYYLNLFEDEANYIEH